MFYDGSSVSAGSGYSYFIGSLFVKPGCSFYAFNGYEGTGESYVENKIINNHFIYYFFVLG